MRKGLLFCIVTLVTFISACTDRDDEISSVNIRIQNSTELFFSEIRIAQNDTTYRDVSSETYSEYLEYDFGFMTDEIRVMTDSSSFTYFPSASAIDSLPIGFYTYELFFDAEEQLQLNFKVDQ